MYGMKIAFIQYSAGRAWVAPVSHVVVEGNAVRGTPANMLLGADGPYVVDKAKTGGVWMRRNQP